MGRRRLTGSRDVQEAKLLREVRQLLFRHRPGQAAARGVRIRNRAEKYPRPTGQRRRSLRRHRANN